MGQDLRRGAGRLTAELPPAPVFVVHSLAHAVAALQAAAECGRPVVLLSAPDAGIYAGPGWFSALVDAAREALPAARFAAVLHCGDSAGAAQGAIRAGIEAIVFTGRADVGVRLTAIAAAHGLRLLREPPAAALDLGRWFFDDIESLRRQCAARLASLPAIC